MKKKFKEVDTITFKCSKETGIHLRGIAMSFTKQEGKLYTVSDLIRDTMQQVFPTPKQLDFTENVDKNKRTTAAAKSKGYGKKPIS